MPLKGLGDLGKKLGQIVDHAQESGDAKPASLTDLLTPEFLTKHTKLSSVEELLKASGFDISSLAALEAIPKGQLDSFVASISSFGSWQEMLKSAGMAWAKGKIGL